MPVDLVALVDPAHTAVVTQELQGGVVGAESLLPELAEAAASVLPAVHRLVVGARAAGVPVVHCLAARRADGRGSNANARLFRGVLDSPVRLLPGTPAAAVVPEVGVEESDLVLTRLHGLGPMGGTDLDPVLRNLGVTTIVGVGVSVNVGMTNFAMDAVNARVPVRASPRRHRRRATVVRRRGHRQHAVAAGHRHHGRRGPRRVVVSMSAALTVRQ